MALQFTDTISSEQGNEGTEVSFTSAPSSVVAGNSGTFGFSVVVGDADDDPGNDQPVTVRARLIVSTEDGEDPVDEKEQDANEDDTVNGTFDYQFESDETTQRGNNRTEEPIWIQVDIDYGQDGYYLNDDTATTNSIEVDVTPAPEETVIFDEDDDVAPGESTLSGTFSDRTSFSIQQIEYEDDAEVRTLYDDDNIEVRDDGSVLRVDRISFYYENPTVAIDGAGRFKKHEIIGGKTVRQKTGEDPLNVSINGVCKQDRANKIDTLRDARHGKIFSNRLPNDDNSLRVQFGSTSTEPITDGSAAELKSGDLLYTFTINAIEVVR